MADKLIKAATAYVEANIKTFHDARLTRLKSLKLNDLLKRKNPYLFRAKNILQAAEFVKALLEAHLSSQEETIFGDFLERFAIHIAGLAVNGQKSHTEGLDLEFTDAQGIRHLVAIKSGPNWGNSSQIDKMKQSFDAARKRVLTSGGSVNVRPINGCCYGIDDSYIKNGYEKLCGERFWTLITGGDDQFYVKMIEPLSHQAKERNEAFQQEYDAVINRFTAEFIKDYCVDGNINWPKLVAVSSKAGALKSGKKPAAKKAKAK
jgi:hypothetical protein